MRGALLFLALAFAACGATTYADVNAGLATGDATIKSFHEFDHDYVVAQIAAHPECHTAASPSACYHATIASYEAAEAPMVKAVGVAAPVLAGIKQAVAAGTANPATLQSELGPIITGLVSGYAQLQALLAPKPAPAVGGVK